MSWTGCRLWVPEKGWTGAKSGILELEHMADRVWPEGDYGYAFAYLYRRFGNGDPGDAYKELCSYYLTTPDPEVCFWINMSGLNLEVGYFMTKTLGSQINATSRHRDDWVKSGEKIFNTYDVQIAPQGTPYRRAMDAIEAGMNDLLRPVMLRDQYLNILGPMDENEASQYECAPNFWERVTK